MYRSPAIPVVLSLCFFLTFSSIPSAFGVQPSSPAGPGVNEAASKQAAPGGPVKDPVPPQGLPGPAPGDSPRAKPVGPNKTSVEASPKVASVKPSPDSNLRKIPPVSPPPQRAAAPPPGKQPVNSPSGTDAGHGPAPQVATTPPAVPETVAEASALRRKIILLKLEEEVAKLEQSIAKIRQGPEATPDRGINSITDLAAAVKGPSRGSTIPEVLAINGKPGHLEAVLLLPEGGTMTVSGSHNVVPGGVKIVSISSDGVRAVVKKKVMDLPFCRPGGRDGSASSPAPQRRVVSSTMVGAH